MAAAYPSGVKTFTTKTNKVDLVDADHVNDLQLEVTAIETELGTDVAGSAATLKARLAIGMADSGAVKQGTSYPGSPIIGQLFYRTDTDIVYIYDGAAWDDVGQPSDGSITEVKLWSVVAGDILLIYADTEETDNNGSYTKVKEIRIARAGTYRVKFDIKNDLGGGHVSYGKIYKNGVAHGTEQSDNTTTYATKSEDLVFEAGDAIQLYTYETGTGTTYIRNFRIYVAVVSQACVILD